MIPAVILAAGRSSRMGRPKALLPLDDDTFLSRIVRALTRGGADEVIVVTTGELDLAPVLPQQDVPVRIVINPTPDRGQLSSLITALDAASSAEVEAVLVTLVDLPLLTESTVRAVLEAYRQPVRPVIVRPTYRGAHGHPVLFDRSLFEELRQADPAKGAREVVHGHAGDTCNVEVDDPGVVEDVDTWVDYTRLIAPNNIRKH